MAKREMGFEEFARILEIPIEEATQMYAVIDKHRIALYRLMHVEDDLNRFAMRWNSTEQVDKLQYVQRHFIGELGKVWQDRIQVLRGEPDEWMEYIKRELEMQRLQERIKELETRKLFVIHAPDGTCIAYTSNEEVAKTYCEKMDSTVPEEKKWGRWFHVYGEAISFEQLEEST